MKTTIRSIDNIVGEINNPKIYINIDNITLPYLSNCTDFLQDLVQFMIIGGKNNFSSYYIDYDCNIPSTHIFNIKTSNRKLIFSFYGFSIKLNVTQQIIDVFTEAFILSKPKKIIIPIIKEYSVRYYISTNCGDKDKNKHKFNPYLKPKEIEVYNKRRNGYLEYDTKEIRVYDDIKNIIARIDKAKIDETIDINSRLSITNKILKVTDQNKNVQFFEINNELIELFKTIEHYWDE
jgi:hypothetical protein